MGRSLHLLPMALAMGGIFFLSHQPGDEISLELFFGVDKVAHAFAYGVLAATVLLALPSRWRTTMPLHAALLAWAVCLLFGLSDEFHQSFVPGREASLGDLVADAFGAALVCGGWFIRMKRTFFR